MTIGEFKEWCKQKKMPDCTLLKIGVEVKTLLPDKKEYSIDTKGKDIADIQDEINEIWLIPESQE